MDGLGFASSMVGVISVAISIQKALFDQSLLLIKRHPDFVKNDLPTLIAFLHDIKNSFLNSREAPPAAAEASMLSCKFYSEKLNRELHKWYGPDLDRKLTVSRRVRIQLGQNTVENAYRSFRHSVLLLKDVCLFFMIQELDLKQVFANEVNERSLHGVTRLESMLFEMQRILVEHYELGNRPNEYHIQKTSQESQSIARHTHKHQSEKEYQDEVDDASLLRLQRNLQREYPDKTVFTAVICPEVQEDQPLKMVAARVLLDTGSDVNIISEKYLQEVGLSHLVTQIPEDEQLEMSGIEEQGPAWKFERKFTSRFFLYSSRATETAEFFVTKSSDWDILISQKQYIKLAADRNSARTKLLWMPRKRRNPKEEAEQRDFERRRQMELENLRNVYDGRESMKRIRQPEGRDLSAAGRAWTIDDNRRAIMSASMSGASGSGPGDLSIRMNSIDEQRSTKLKEASIRSGTMQDGSDDES